MNKKGLSTVVATVLILLITVAAATLIFTIVVPLVQNNLDKSTQCLSYQDYFKFQKSFEFNGSEYNYNCHELVGTDNLYGLSITAANINKSGNIQGFKLSFIKEDSKGITVFSGQPTNSSYGGIRMLDLSISSTIIPGAGEVYTYVFNASSDLFSELEISPIIFSSASASGKICPSTDKIKFTDCVSPVRLNL